MQLTRFVRIYNPGALTANALKHVSLWTDSDVTGVGPDTPIHGLQFSNQSAATITAYITGATVIIHPGASVPYEHGGTIREFTLTPDATVATGKLQIAVKGPAVG